MHKLKKTKSKKDEWFRMKLSINQKLSVQLESYYINLKYYKNLKNKKLKKSGSEWSYVINGTIRINMPCPCTIFLKNSRLCVNFFCK